MIFARIGHGSCYYCWNEIFAGVSNLSYLKVETIDCQRQPYWRVYHSDVPEILSELFERKKIILEKIIIPLLIRYTFKLVGVPIFS